MRLWRISNHESLSGEGGLHASGRWHSRGRRVLYLADHPAAALLEVMVHLEIDAADLPSHFQLLRLDVPDDLTMTRLDDSDLPEGWRRQKALTQARGDTWLAATATALLRVPSAIVPDAVNFLLNPAHADAGRIDIASVVRAPYDPRLVAFVPR